MARYTGPTPEVGRKLVRACRAVQIRKGARHQFAERLAVKFDRNSGVSLPPEKSLLRPHHDDSRHALWLRAERRQRRQWRTTLRRTTEQYCSKTKGWI